MDPCSELGTKTPSEKITCLVIGDPHFKVGNFRETERLADRAAILASEKKPSFIVVLGDVLDRHEMVNVLALERAIKFLRRLSRLAPTFVLAGNHDRPNNSDFLSPFHALVGLDDSDLSASRPENFAEKSSPETLPYCYFSTFRQLHEARPLTVVARVQLLQVGALRLAFVPYVPPGRFAEALLTRGLGPEALAGPTPSPSAPDQRQETHSGAAPHCIFAHQEFQGAKMGAYASEIGDPWPHNYPLVVSGHIHDFDWLQPNVLYPGTPIQHAFGDRGDKTVSWLEFDFGGPSDDGAVDASAIFRAVDSSAKNQHSVSGLSFSHARIDLGLPRKALFRLEAAEVAAFDLPARLGGSPAEKEVKIIISGSSAELKAAMKNQKLAGWRQAGVKISYKDVPPPSRESELVSRLTAEAPGGLLKSVPFTQLLYLAVKDEPELLGVYKKIGQLTL